MSKTPEISTAERLGQIFLAAVSGAFIGPCFYIFGIYVTEARINSDVALTFAAAGSVLGALIGFVANVERFKKDCANHAMVVAVTTAFMLFFGAPIYVGIMIARVSPVAEWWRPRTLVAFTADGVIYASILGISLGLIISLTIQLFKKRQLP